MLRQNIILMKYMEKSKLNLILTCGDISGIAPEIIIRIFHTTDLFRRFNIKICADEWMFNIYYNLLQFKKIPSEYFEPLGIKEFKYIPGNPYVKTAEVSAKSFLKSVKLCLDKKKDAMITLPVSKFAINNSGIKFTGHTEMLGRMLKEIPIMIFYSKKFLMSLITSHIPIKKVSRSITKEKIINKILLLNQILKRDFRINNPKIALLSLNPHCGDNGVMGNEEIEKINPAMEELKNSGINISGVFASDGFFGLKKFNDYNLTVGMYHDQILNPFKLLCFDKGVNFTGGLSIVRTSPDHGTAFDIAGKGIAKIESTVSAIRLAARIANNWRRAEC